MRLALFLVFSALVFAQSVEVGFEGGVPLTHVFSATGVTATGIAPYEVYGRCDGCGTERTLPYVIGPKILVHLWKPLYLDAEALYSRADYAFSAGTFAKRTVDRWEMPVLLKLQFNSQHFVRPFVAGGVSFQHSFDATIPPSATAIVGPGDVNSAFGVTFAAGTSFGFRRVRPSVEFRYTRWTDTPISTYALTVQSKQDEVQLLAGLTLGVAKRQPDSPGVLEGPSSNRRVSLGIKGGLPLTDALSTHFLAGTNSPIFGTCLECGTARTLPYLVGPAFGVRIVGGLSATAEVLYSRADYEHTSVMAAVAHEISLIEEKHVVGHWEAPLLLKYSFQMRHLTPFVSAGASLQYDRDSQVRKLIVENFFIGFPPPPLQYFLDTTSYRPMGSLVVGPTVGLGATFDAAHRVHPSVEFRYTYWTDQAIVARPPSSNACGSACRVPNLPPTIFSAHNQVQLLVGIMF